MTEAAKTYSVCPACGAANRYDPRRADAAKCGQCHRALAVHRAVSDRSDGALAKLVDASPLPRVVDFWAPWCGPCRAFAPVFSSVALRDAGRFVFAKIDTEGHPAAAQRFQIRGIPTLIAFAGGKEVARQSGAMSEAMLTQWLEKLKA
jgi:thioredoxin 2